MIGSVSLLSDIERGEIADLRDPKLDGKSAKSLEKDGLDEGERAILQTTATCRPAPKKTNRA